MDFNLSKEQELLRDGLTASSCRRVTTSRKAAPRPRPGSRLAARHLAWIRRRARHPRRRAAGGCGRNRRRPSRSHGDRRGARGMHWWWSPTSTPSWWPADCCTRAGGPVADAAAGEDRGRRPRSSRWRRRKRRSGEHWQDVSTIAERDGDGWVLRGSKIVAMTRADSPPIC